MLITPNHIFNTSVVGFCPSRYVSRMKFLDNFAPAFHDTSTDKD